MSNIKSCEMQESAVVVYGTLNLFILNFVCTLI